MLDTFRKQSKSVIIYVFFGIIIAVFIINFGPQSQGCESTTDAFAARVRGRTLTENDFRYAMVMSGASDRSAPKLREFVMDRLLEREVLAAEAERMGFRVSDEDVRDLLATGTVLALGRRQDLRERLFKDGALDYESFRKFALYQFGMTVKRFEAHQQRELLAEKVRELVRASARVSDEEVRADHLSREQQVNLEFVRIAPGQMEKEVEVADAEIDALLAKGRDRTRERYASRKFLYEKLPREVRARHLLVAAPRAADAHARAEALLARAKAGEDFAALARADSADAATRARGGDLGWRRRGATGLGEAVENHVFGGKPGDLLGPFEDAAGAHLVRVEAFREGDQPYEKVEREIAEALVREDRARALARKTAEDLLARLRAGEKWEELFAAAKTDEASEPAAEGGEEGAGDKAEGAAEPAAPKAATAWVSRETGLFARRGTMVNRIGPSQELLAAAFALTAEKPLSERVFEVAGGVHLVRLKERREPDMKEFEGRGAEIASAYAAAKGERALADLSRTLCEEAKPKVDASLVESGEEGPAYTACATLSVD